MKRVKTVVGGIVLFSAGLLAGHYGALSILAEPSDADTTSVTSIAKSSSAHSGIQRAPSAQGWRHSSADTSSATKNHANEQEPIGIPPPPPAFRLTAEEQAQIAAQQLEVKHAQLEQLDAMIQSMKENNLPAQEIQSFIDLKVALEKQPALEAEPTVADLPEPSAEEIRSEMAASMEQAGIPSKDREQMLEAFSPSAESKSPDTDGAAPPQPPEIPE